MVADWSRFVRRNLTACAAVDVVQPTLRFVVQLLTLMLRDLPSSAAIAAAEGNHINCNAANCGNHDKKAAHRDRLFFFRIQKINWRTYRGTGVSTPSRQHQWALGLPAHRLFGVFVLWGGASRRPPDAFIDKSMALRLFGPVNIAEINNDRPLHDLF